MANKRSAIFAIGFLVTDLFMGILWNVVASVSFRHFAWCHKKSMHLSNSVATI